MWFIVKHKRDVCASGGTKAKIITGQLQKRSDRNFSRRADSVCGNKKRRPTRNKNYRVARTLYEAEKRLGGWCVLVENFHERALGWIILPIYDGLTPRRVALS